MAYDSFFGGESILDTAYRFVEGGLDDLEWDGEWNVENKKVVDELDELDETNIGGVGNRSEKYDYIDFEAGLSPIIGGQFIKDDDICDILCPVKQTVRNHVDDELDELDILKPLDNKIKIGKAKRHDESKNINNKLVNFRVVKNIIRNNINFISNI